ncbi:MAG: DNA repair protein RecN, partial [Clostridia bacterium]|nr:DNA repair protein RecN [Clostridia bacterium]
IEKPLSDYYSEFRNLNAIRKELSECQTDEDIKQRKIELLKYQISEIETADINLGEYEKLKNQLEILKNYEKTVKTLREAYLLIKGNDDTIGAAEQISGAGRLLGSDILKGFEKHSEKLSEISALLESIGGDILAFLEDRELSDTDPDMVNSRLDMLSKLMKKYGGSEEKTLEFCENAKKELENIEFSSKREEELSYLLSMSTDRLIALAEVLSDKRIKAGTEFSKQVCQVLSYLNMPDVKFSINAEKGKYTKIGCDKMEFLISANAGESAKPLSKIASGGELSRVMLAIKSVLADRDSVDTLIFDEIDTGISGYAAGKVGKQLKSVAKSKQVICVTHLAQIAAEAQNHLVIEKSTSGGRTFTSVRSVLGDERIAEIARIMSGSELTDNLYKSAKELLDRSKKDENL